jgi:hypothetical protein
LNRRGAGTKVSPTGPRGEVYPDVPPFRPAWWLPGAHAQTIWGSLVRPRSRRAPRREVLATPDGDALVVDWTDGPAGAPVLLVLHGLEGSSGSGYAANLVRLAARRGWRGAALNFRSCAREPKRRGRALANLRPRLYHSGETGDLNFAVETLAAREPGTPLVAAGVSLGGNVLLKWLGENPAQRRIAAAGTISAPYDLAAGARHLERFPGSVYARPLLASLRRKALAAAARFPEAAARIDLARARRARTFREFDDAATAPLHGFAGVDDYYARSSSLAYLSAIRTPTLCLSAADDPFLPAEAAERARAAASSAVTFVTLPAGGHVGFVSGRVPWRARRWAEETLVDWLGAFVAAARSAGAV